MQKLQRPRNLTREGVMGVVDSMPRQQRDALEDFLLTEVTPGVVDDIPAPEIFDYSAYSPHQIWDGISSAIGNPELLKGQALNEARSHPNLLPLAALGSAVLAIVVGFTTLYPRDTSTLPISLDSSVELKTFVMDRVQLNHAYDEIEGFVDLEVYVLANDRLSKVRSFELTEELSDLALQREKELVVGAFDNARYSALEAGYGTFSLSRGDLEFVEDLQRENPQLKDLVQQKATSFAESLYLDLAREISDGYFFEFRADDLAVAQRVCTDFDLGEEVQRDLDRKFADSVYLRALELAENGNGKSVQEALDLVRPIVDTEYGREQELKILKTVYDDAERWSTISHHSFSGRHDYGMHLARELGDQDWIAKFESLEYTGRH
jgi:hypothetical protein